MSLVIASGLLGWVAAPCPAASSGPTNTIPAESGLPGPVGWLTDLVLSQIAGAYTDPLPLTNTMRLDLPGLGSTNQGKAIDLAVTVETILDHGTGTGDLKLTGEVLAQTTEPIPVTLPAIGPVDVTLEQIRFNMSTEYDPRQPRTLFDPRSFEFELMLKVAKPLDLAKLADYLKLPSLRDKLKELNEYVEVEAYLIGDVAYNYDFQQEAHGLGITFGQGILAYTKGSQYFYVEASGEVDQEATLQSAGNTFDIVLKASASVQTLGYEVYGDDASARYRVFPGTRSDGAPVNFDQDQDGLPDKFENSYPTNEVTGMHLNARDPDSDADGLGDAFELNTWGTDPTDSDSDDDGLLDGEEKDFFLGLDIEPTANHDQDEYENNLRDYDSDNEGLKDGYERQFGTNPIVQDTDGDGLTDYEELVLCTCAGTDPLSGWYTNCPSDRAQTCPTNALHAGGPNPDPTQKHSDNDGWHDGREYQLLKYLERDPASLLSLLVQTPYTNVYEGVQAEIQRLGLAQVTLAAPTQTNLLHSLDVGIILPDADPDIEGRLAARGIGVEVSSLTIENQLRTAGQALVLIPWLDMEPSPVAIATMEANGITVAPIRLEELQNLRDNGVAFSLPGLGPCGDHDFDGVYNLRDDQFPPVPPPPYSGDGDGDTLADELEENTGWALSCGPISVAIGSSSAFKDTDCDGVSDTNEIARGTNPLTGDTDGDGLLDGEESRYGTQPCDPDSDDDGINDYEEVHGWNWNVARISNNTLGFLNQQALLIPSPASNGFSGSLFTNWISLLYSNTDPYRIRWTSNPTNADTDGDGLCDGFEKLLVLNPNDPDTDGDGLNDPEGWGLVVSTNCLGLPVPLLMNIEGVKQAILHARVADPHRADSDMDGLKDGEEQVTYHTDPTNPDTDGDLLNDSYEVDTLVRLFPTNYTKHSNGQVVTQLLVTCVDVFDPDTDGDHLSDGFEVRFNGLRPTNQFQRVMPPLNLAGAPRMKPRIVSTHPCHWDTDSNGVSDFLDLIRGGVLLPAFAVDPDGFLISPYVGTWELIGDDGVQFNLQSGLVFHDGNPVDAGSLLFNLASPLNWGPGMTRPSLFELGIAESLQPVDYLTGIVWLAGATTAEQLFRALVETDYLIASPSAVSTLGERFPFQPVGSGPFMVTGFDDVNQLALVSEFCPAWVTRVQLAWNADFAQGSFAPWGLDAGYNPGHPQPQMEIADLGGLTNAAHLHRAMDTDGSHAIVSQSITQAVGLGQHLRLSFDVRIDWHNFARYESWNVYPANVWVDYIDVLGQPATFRRSFYLDIALGHQPDPPPLVEQIPPGTWMHRSYDLANLDPPVAQLVRLRFGAQGWSYDVAFDHVVVELLGPTPPGRPLLTLPTVAADRFSVLVAGEKGRTYRLEYKNTLVEPVWHPLLEIEGNGLVQSLTDLDPVTRQRFYRVVAQ